MSTKQFSGSTLYKRFPSRSRERNGVQNGAKMVSLGCSSEIPKGLGFRDVPSSCCLSSKYRSSVSPLVIHRRKRSVGLVYNQSNSGYGVESTNLQGRPALDDEEEEEAINGSRDEALETARVPIHEQHSSEKSGNLTPSLDSTKVPIHESDIKRELVMLSLPAMAGQAIDPLAQLMETAYIGRLVCPSSVVFVCANIHGVLELVIERISTVLWKLKNN